MTSTLLLVAAGDVDHCGGVKRCTRAGANTNADACATHRLRRARVATNRSATACCCGCSGSWVVLLSGATVETCARLHRQAGVDHRHQSTDRSSRVAVEVADRCVQVKLQLVDEVGRNVGLRESSHVAKLLGGVVRHQTVHLDVLGVDAQAIGDTLGQECEDLADGSRAAGDEAVVQAIVETDLNKGAVRWHFRDSTRRLNHARHRGREASRRSSGGDIRCEGAANVVTIRRTGRRSGVARRERKASWHLEGRG